VKFPLSLLLPVLLIVPACSQNAPRSTQAAPEERSNPTTEQRSNPAGQMDQTDQMKKDRDEYVKSMDAHLSEFDQKMDGLDKRADSMTGTAKSEFMTFMNQLKDQRKDVAKKLDDLKGVSAESWMSMKGEVDSAMTGLDHAYDQISNKFPAKPATR
jgi:hypothetical protein